MYYESQGSLFMPSRRLRPPDNLYTLNGLNVMANVVSLPKIELGRLRDFSDGRSRNPYFSQQNSKERENSP